MVDPSHPTRGEVIDFDGRPPTRPSLEIILSVEDELLVLARLGISTVASRAGFDIEEVDDLRLAVDELCLLVLQGRRSGRLHLAFATGGGRIDVWCNYEGDVPDRDRDTEDGADLVGLSGRILDALVDEHGPSVRDGLPGAHMCKRRVRSNG